MKLTRSEIAIELAAIETLVPVMLEDRDTFLTVFDIIGQKLLARMAEADHASVYAALEGIVERSGYRR